MNPKRKYEDMERSTSDMTDFRRPPYAVQYPKSGYSDTQNMSTAAKLIREQGGQVMRKEGESGKKITQVIFEADNRCVMCGEIIPEGQQMCKTCMGQPIRIGRIREGGIK